MENEDRESPSSSPVPGPGRPPQNEDDLSLGGEAEPYQAPDQDEELGLAGPSYRYIEDDGNSPAPSHSGLEADYEMLSLPQESSLSRQFVWTRDTVSSSPSAPCSSSSSGLQSSFPAPMSSASTSRVSGPSSDPVFSAHSQPLHWDTGPDLPISSSWGVGASGQSASQQPPAPGRRDMVWEQDPQMRPGPSGWESEAGCSGLEQEVPGDLSLEPREDQERNLDYEAAGALSSLASSSNGMERPELDYSEENTMEAEAQQSFIQYPSLTFSPQPSSTASNVSGSMISSRFPERSLADMLADARSSIASSESIQLSVPGTSRNQMISANNSETSNSAKRPRISHADSLTPGEYLQSKRLRLGGPQYKTILKTPNGIDIDLDSPPSPQPQDGSSESEPIPISMANQINREIENCLREDVGQGSRSNSNEMDPVPGPSRRHQSVPSASFGSVASSVSYLSYRNESQPESSRVLYGHPQNNDRILQPAQGPSSPTGSEVLAAGPSRPIEQNDDQDSPSGSEEAAGSSQNQGHPAINNIINPNSPAPSESDPDEAGPSNQGYMVRFGPQLGNPTNSEAAPRGRPSSPDRRVRTRRLLSDNCLISSSTGPVDSNPPTPEMFGVSGDIDYEYSPSPHVRRYNARYDDNDDAVVDSTVDSTNIPFVIHDYEDNEVRDIDDNDEDTEDESVAGSEASSTTSSRSRIEDHRLSLPGQDDNEGISTSGQVDVGQFRLVPNDIEMNFDGAFPEGPVPAPVAAPVEEDIEEIILEDNPIPGPLPEPQQEQRNAEVTFKKPFNRKERIMENVNIDLEPVAGSSGLQRRNTQADQQNGSSSSSLYSDLSDSYLAFSGLPSSLSQPQKKSSEEVGPNDGENGDKSDNSRSVPLSKRLKSRHLQDQEKSKRNFESGEETRGNPVSSRATEYQRTDILRSSLERGLSNNTVSNEQEVRPEPLVVVDQNNGNNRVEIESSNNLGGVQQSFSVILETSNQYLSSMKPKRIMQTKSAAELKEYLPLDESLNNDDEDIESLDSFLHRDQNLDLEDTSFLTPKKGPSEENPQSEDIEADQEPNRQDHEITIMISDQPVQSRAVASLPTQYLSLRPVQIQGQGSGLSVFAVRDIQASSRFGPLEGRLVDPGQDINTAISLAFIIQGQRLDVSSEEDSNWMRFIRPATNTVEQNLSLHEFNGQLYFKATRQIGQNEELRVWYSEEYATQHSLPSKPTEIATRPPVANIKKRPPISPTVGQNLAEKTKKDSNGPNFTCDICQRKFERQASLLRHLALHKGDKNYTCPDCGQKFSHTFNLERHRKKAHNTDPEGQHVCCNVCSIWFPSNMVLKVHMFSHHPNKEEQNWTVEDAMAQSGKESNERDHEEMKFQCPSDGCECQYDTWLQLVEHAMDHGSRVLPSSNNNPNKGPVHKCELCYKTFANDARLKKHMAVHEGDSNKPLSCDDCGKRFLTNSALAGHVKIHAHPDTLYDCPMCGQEFEQVSSLKDHVYDHKENGVFTCQHCDKTFSEYPQIRKHIRAFHAEKRFPCTICDKSFTGKDKLKVHMVRHSEQKDFSCTECEKQFKRKDKLREHEKRMHKTPVGHSQPSVIPEASCSKFVPKVI